METPKIFYYDTHQIIKKKFFFLAYTKRDKENIMLFKTQDKSYNIIDLYLNRNIFCGYKDSYNYYDIDVDKILFVISDNEYIIRYNDVNKKKTVPLQSKISNFYFGELHMFTNKVTLMPIHSDDKEFFRKCREIWNKITELIGINDIPDFVETTLDDDEFIIVDVHKTTGPVRDKYRNNFVTVLHSVFNNYHQTSLVQYRY